MHVAKTVSSVVFGCLVLQWMGCSPSSNDSTEAEPGTAIESPTAASADATSPDAPRGSITAENIVEQERYWPNITALDRAWLPPDSDEPLKKGWRGALIRVDDQGRARIAFGRHGNHDIPIEFTDLVERANQVEAGTLHKVAPNFIAHFGTQFVHPSTEESLPFPTTELTSAGALLCVFTDPRDPGFEALARKLAALEQERPELQMLLFPLSMQRAELAAVRQRLKAVSWPVPFAYPEAAEVQARSLLGSVPTSPWALMVSPEGRILFQGELSDERVIDSIRAAAPGAPIDPLSASPSPASQDG